MAGTKTTTENMSQAATLVFNDVTTGDMVSIPDNIDDVSVMDHIGATDISDFFARPIRITQNTWANLSNGKFLIWLDYLNNPVVKNKISNYAYLRGNLHIKIVVNSSPFYYGALQVAYYPYNLDQSSINYGINGFIKPTKVPSVLHPYLQSTLPHCVIEAATCKGCEMVLPFIYDRNYLDLSKSQGIGRMGTLSFEELAPLRTCSSGTPLANVSIYAWMEDVVLTGATQVAVVQSDAYGTGPVSKPASVVANIANSLSNAPIIGPYARATNIAASAVGKIASMFGFSNIPLIEPIRHYRTTGIGNLASSEIGSQIEKLSLDPKNELSIDPRITGASDDDMVMSKIIQREGLASISDWEINQSADTSIWTTKVNPNYIATAIGVAPEVTSTYLTPLAHISNPFLFWRGDIIFRFKLIASKYHKGRLRISWDTLGPPIRNTSNYNTALTAIWDISETHEMEFVVPYQNETAFLPINSSMSPDGINVTPNSVLTDDPYSNGILTIVVVNQLSSPIDVAPVTLLSYVRGADNFELAGPTQPLGVGDDSLQFSFIEPQSETVTSLDFKNLKDKNDNLYSVHFGEVVKSIKVLMYRTNYLGYNVAPASNSSDSQISLPRLPLHYGYDPNGINLARNQDDTSNVSFNWIKTTPYHWFSPAYVFQRGSHNYRMYTWGTNHALWAMRVPYNQISGSVNNDYRAAVITPIDDTARGAIVAYPNTTPAGQGCSLAISDVNATLEFSTPLYSRYRAVTNNPLSPNLPPYAYLNSSDNNAILPSIEENARDGHNLEGIVVTARGTGGEFLRYDMFHSVGVDFSLSFYRGCPALYSLSIPAAAV